MPLATRNLSGRVPMWVLLSTSLAIVSVGLLLTPWELRDEALVGALVALVAGAVLYLQLRLRHKLTGPALLAQGILYLGYVAYVFTKL